MGKKNTPKAVKARKAAQKVAAKPTATKPTATKPTADVEECHLLLDGMISEGKEILNQSKETDTLFNQTMATVTKTDTSRKEEKIRQLEEQRKDLKKENQILKEELKEIEEDVQNDITKLKNDYGKEIARWKDKAIYWENRNEEAEKLMSQLDVHRMKSEKRLRRAKFWLGI